MIERALHEILSDEEIDGTPLDVLQGKIITGQVQAGDLPLPYATINVENNNSLYYSNGGSPRRATVRVQLWHDSHAQGCELRAKLIGIVDNKNFTTSEAAILCCRHENDFAVQEEDGVWQFIIDFDVMIEGT